MQEEVQGDDDVNEEPEETSELEELKIYFGELEELVLIQIIPDEE